MGSNPTSVKSTFFQILDMPERATSMQLNEPPLGATASNSVLSQLQGGVASGVPGTTALVQLMAPLMESLIKKQLQREPMQPMDMEEVDVEDEDEDDDDDDEDDDDNEDEEEEEEEEQEEEGEDTQLATAQSAAAAATASAEEEKEKGKKEILAQKAGSLMMK